MSLDLFFPVRQIDDTTIVTGDCREVLKMMEPQSVQCCVTSPPYFGLRDYGTGTWVGGDENCDHSVGGQVQDSKAPGAIVSGVRPGVDASTCRSCGASRVDSQLGLEKTPDEYVAQMVAVFREVRRVLRDDGVLWLNLGDSYAGSGKGGNPDTGKHATNKGSQSIGVLYGTGATAREAAVTNVTRKTFDGIKAKDLIGIPWMVALALRADGWYLRQDIIWHKPNPMPESVTDRCTKAHEYIFMLTKSQRYFYDADAVKEQSVYEGRQKSQKRGEFGGKNADTPGKEAFRAVPEDGLRNRRSVWSVATAPYKGAHFATFPPALIEPCVLAGSRPGDMVLDPFGGSGTTAQVAAQNSRKSLVIELNPNYINLCEQRVANTITPKDHLTMLTLTNVQDALGLKIPADFITNELKITPAKTDKRAVFFEPAQLATICDALIQHIHGVKTGTKTMVAKPKKDKAPSLDDLF